MNTRQIATILKIRSSSPDIRLLSDALIEVLRLRPDTLLKSVDAIERNLNRKLGALKTDGRKKGSLEREE